MQLICPKCQGVMRQYERNGVTVDQCGECRGIFLDRGELDRLIDAENSWHGQPGSHQPQASHQQPQSYQQPHRKKRKSFLDELFD